MFSKGMNAMSALLKFLVLLALVLLASHANEFTGLSLVEGNQVRINHLTWLQQPMSDPKNEPSREPIREPTKWIDMNAVLPNNLSQINNSVLSNHSNQQESLADQPGIDEEINYPIAASNSSQPTLINLASSGLCCSSRTEVLNRRGLVYSDTTLMDHDERPTSPQVTHLCSASQRSFSSARVPFFTICPFGGLSCWVQSLAVKVQASSTPKVSRHAAALSAFKPITSTNQNSFAAIALKAIAEMQASADSNKTCNTFGFGTLAHEHQCLNITQPIFQLIDVSVTNFQLILIVDSFQSKQELPFWSPTSIQFLTELNKFL